SNPHIYFGQVRAYDASEWSQFATLRDGTQRVINLSDNQGLISLPSLHAAHAVVFVYVTRHLRGWNVGLAVVNVVMTIAAVPFGGHYLVDILAGIALALVVIWALRRMSLRRNLALHPS
ncbi:phosphatase PAP2 family protein, partial [Pandoraea sp. PE-S2R-1]|uniref:phosphatase PAP2 family protein n=1 Tax=Pandoraea sp. PE-S2R-1 TaxID=1986994 RepID=UPI0011324C2E